MSEKWRNFATVYKLCNMKLLYKFYTFLVLLLCCSAMHASVQADESGGDSIEVGFLTCAPGTEVYELYGHTALRIRNFKSGEDWVFNYGVLNFPTPHFAWRFMLGQTDFMFGALPFDAFAASYSREGRSVEEQVLNLLPEEKEVLWESLVATAMTPDWTYRYNFLYDNCTTRAVAEIERCVQGRIEWRELPGGGGRTFRDIIHEFASEDCPWNAFGQDLILGEETDRPIGIDQRMFSPIYAQRYFDKAVIKAADGTMRPLVKRTEMVVNARPKPVEKFPLSPALSVALLLLAMVAAGAYEWRKRKICRWIDCLWMSLWGGTGCIVFILFFFSEHPAVGSNWLVVLLNPLPLLALPFKIWNDRQRRRDLYPLAASLAICLFGVLGMFMPQRVPVLFYAMLAILLARCLHLLLLQRSLEGRGKNAQR